MFVNILANIDVSFRRCPQGEHCCYVVLLSAA